MTALSAVQVVKLLLDRAEYIEAKCQAGQTALWWASGWSRLAKEDEFLPLVELLLDRGAVVETKCRDDRTPLPYTLTELLQTYSS